MGLFSESWHRELAGFDLQIIFARTPHLIELKILTGPPSGASQLAAYMHHEGRGEGWLVYFDARPPANKTALPLAYSVHAGTIHVIAIDVRPRPPSKRRDCGGTSHSVLRRSRLAGQPVLGAPVFSAFDICKEELLSLTFGAGKDR